MQQAPLLAALASRAQQRAVASLAASGQSREGETFVPFSKCMETHFTARTK